MFNLFRGAECVTESLHVIQGNVPTSETNSEHLFTPVITPLLKAMTQVITTGIVREDALLISPITPHSMVYLINTEITGDILLSPDCCIAADLLAGRVEGTVLSLTWSTLLLPAPVITWYTV